jgi:hypothetical protein
MTTLTYPNTYFTFIDGITGSTGTTITATSITTPSLIVNNIIDSNGSTGASGNVLSYTANGIVWTNATSSSGITGNINMNAYNINNAGTIECTNLNATTINATTFSNQIAFTSAPTCSIEPTAANHIANKNYVDSSTSNRVYNLYLNQSQLITVPLVSGSTGYSKLSDLVRSNVQASPLSRTITAGTTGGILSFISDPINITEIPACILNVNIYGNNTTAGTLNICYTCNVRLYSGVTITTLGTSQSSRILNNTTGFPLLYSMSVSVQSRSTLLADRFIIELFASNRSVSSVTLHTYFENNFYSYAQIQSNRIIPFTNNYIFNSLTSNLNMNGFNINSTENLSISCPNKILSLGNSSSIINIENQTSGNIYIGSTNKTINIGKPFNIDYFSNTNTAALGYTFSPVFTRSPTTGIYPATLTSSVTATTSIPIGTWMFSLSWVIDFSNTAAGVTINNFIIKLYKDGTASGSNYLWGRQIRKSNAVTTGSNIRTHCTGIVRGPTTLLFVTNLNRTVTRLAGICNFNNVLFTRIG